MSRFEKWFAIVLACLILSMGYAVISVLGKASVSAAVLATPRAVVHLPSICIGYYNSGTDEWINCMGVGRK